MLPHWAVNRKSGMSLGFGQQPMNTAAQRLAAGSRGPLGDSPAGQTSGRARRSASPAAMALLAGTLLLASGCDDQKNAYAPPPPPKVIVAKPVIQTVPETLEFTGNTAAFETVKLVARVEGYLTKIHFDDGQRVKKGDVLFTIQQDQYRADVAKAQSEVDAATARLDYAAREFERFSRLVSQKAAAAIDVDKWRFERDSSRADLEAAEANLANASLDLGYTTVTAPFDGRMSRHLIDAGNLVGSGGVETVLAEINRVDPIYVYFTINERDLLRVTKETSPSNRGSGGRQTKQVLNMGLSTDDGFPFQGVLDYAAITVNAQTGTLQLRGVFPNPDFRIIPGLFARIQAAYAEKQNAVLVPAEAVGFDQQGNFVLTVDDKNVVQRKTVETGETFGNRQVIASGLTGNEWIIVDGLQRSIPGREVKPEPAAGEATAPPPAAGAAKPDKPAT